MKLLTIIPNLGYGGAESLLLTWLRYWLKDSDVEKVVLILYSDNFIHRLDDIIDHPKFQLEIEKSNTPWRMFRFRYFLHLLRLWRIIKKHDPDIIQSNLITNIDLALLYRWLPRVKGFVHTAHNQADKIAPRHYRFLLKKFYSAKRVHHVAISRSVADSIKSFFKTGSHLIFNGAAQPRETALRDQVREEVQQLVKANSDDSKKVFIAVGRVMHVKNYELMTAVFQRFFREKSNVILLVLGDLINDENRAKYLPMAKQNIFFLDKKDNVGDYLRCADFYCMTSHYEGLPLSPVEAISVGVIPVITPTIGLLEVIPSAEHGVISADMSEDSYYQAVRKALTLSEEERKRIREKNYKWYEENFSFRRCAEAYLSIFREIAK